MYQEGDKLPLSRDGNQYGTIKVVSVIEERGETQIVAEVIELRHDYSGTFKVGTRLKFPEDGYVGTFDNEKNVTRHAISNLNDIYGFADNLKAAVGFYD